MSRFKKLGMAIICVFLIYAVVGANLHSKSQYNNDLTKAELNVAVPSSSSLIVHGKISISGNAQLIAFPNKTGSGTPADPYLIKDLSINASGVGRAISIGGTTKNLIIRNCTLFGSQTGFSGVDISVANNIIIELCTIKNNGAHGLSLYGINLTIQNNSIYNNVQYGIYLIYSSYINILYNTISNNSNGVYSYSSTPNIVFKGNYIFNNTNNGAFVYYSGVHFINNTFANNVAGIYYSTQPSSLSSIVIKNIFINNSKYGVYVDTTYGAFKNCIFYHNMFQNNIYSQFYFQTNAYINVTWDNGSIGNYWGDYKTLYPLATSTNGTWNTQYQINGTTNGYDRFPRTVPFWNISLPDEEIPEPPIDNNTVPDDENPNNEPAVENNNNVYIYIGLAVAVTAGAVGIYFIFIKKIK